MVSQLWPCRWEQALGGRQNRLVLDSVGSRVSYSLRAALLPLYCHVREKETILCELLYLGAPSLKAAYLESYRIKIFIYIQQAILFLSMWKLFLAVFGTRLGSGRVSFGRKKKAVLHHGILEVWFSHWKKMVHLHFLFQEHNSFTLTDIYWVPTLCKTLQESLGIQRWNRHGSCPQGAHNLLGQTPDIHKQMYYKIGCIL